METKNLLFAYSAGIIDGEGSILIARRKPGRDGTLSHGYVLILTIGMTDREALDDISEEWGGNVLVDPPAKQGWQPRYNWKISGRSAVKMIKEILPYIRIKRAQCNLAIEFHSYMMETKSLTYGSRNGVARGVRVPSEINEIRDSFYHKMKVLNKRGC